MATLGLNNPFVQNPFLQSLSSLLYANPAAAPSWAGHLSNKAVASMWNYNDAKRLQQPHEEEEVNIVFILVNIVLLVVSLCCSGCFQLLSVMCRNKWPSGFL